MHLSRRHVLATSAITAAAPLVAVVPAAAAGSTPAELEARYGVRLGLAARNLGTGRTLTYRADERFPMLSTFKVLAVGAVLRDHDRHGELLGRQVTIRPEEVVENSPITSLRPRMSVAELCDAALRYSDNTAGNKLLEIIGGPRGLTAFARSLGDRVTRLDRREPELNDAVPGDPRDTTTPSALAADYQRVLLGDALGTSDRWLLRAWMQGNTTSATRMKAGLPATWTLADKTGAGDYGTLNDAGLAIAPDGTAILIAALSRSDDPAHVANNDLMRDVAASVVAELG